MTVTTKTESPTVLPAWEGKGGGRGRGETAGNSVKEGALQAKIFMPRSPCNLAKSKDGFQTNQTSSKGKREDAQWRKKRQAGTGRQTSSTIKVTS